MYAAHVLNRQRRDVLDVALHDPFEAVANADHVHTLEPCTDRRGADDAVQARRGTAPAEDGELVMLIHEADIVISDPSCAQFCAVFARFYRYSGVPPLEGDLLL